MCGITGIVSAELAPAAEDIVERMSAALAHRGPDDSGMYVDGAAALGFRRLAIIDVASGRQPMVSPRTGRVLVYNGEIYNYRDLRQVLKSDYGIGFQTESDTEVLLAALDVWGCEKALPRLNGMFAFALWDPQERRLILGRDRAGKKPLYYTFAAQTLLFASEIKALLLHPHFRAEADPLRIVSGLTYRYVPGAENYFRGVEALPPGHIAVYEPGETFQVKRWWEFEPLTMATRPDRSVEQEHLAQLQELLMDSVSSRMTADVPVGAFLSGGVDSSLIVALMARLSKEPVRTFSAGFSSGHSEHLAARELAKQLQTEHYETIIGPADIMANLKAVLRCRESPVSEPSDVALFILARDAARHVKVVLSGEGCDELFAGYPKYQAIQLSQGMLKRPLGMAARAAHRLLPNNARLETLASALGSTDPAESSSRWFGAFSAEERRRLLRPEFADLDPHQFAGEVHKRSVNTDAVLQEQLQDFSHWLPANLLLRGDRVTMAHGLELRCPYLDHRMVEFAYGQLHLAEKLSPFATKRIVRRLAAQVLPPDVAGRKKWGFKVPIGEWFRQELKDQVCDTLLSQAARQRGYFNMAVVEALLQQHLRGKRDWTKQLWYLYQLELWHREFIDQRPGGDQGRLDPSGNTTGLNRTQLLSSMTGSRSKICG